MQGLPAMCSAFVIVLCSNTFQSDQLRVPVIAEFTSPGPRTIFMRIVDAKEAAASSKHTPPHWGPIATGGRAPRYSKAVIAHSDRTGYRACDAPLP